MVNEMPNLTGVRREAAQLHRRFGRFDLRAPGCVVALGGQPIQQLGQDVVGDDLAVGRGVAGAASIQVDPADLQGVFAQVPRDGLDDVLDLRHALRAAKAAKRRVRRQVRATRAAVRAEVGDEVRVLGVQHGALEDRRRQIGVGAAVAVQLDVERVDAAVVVKAHLPAHAERVALAGAAGVLVARVDKAGGNAVSRGDPRGERGGHRGLRLLAAKAAAHAPALGRDLVERQIQQLRHHLLDLGGVLAGAEHADSAFFARDRACRLRLQVELLLAVDPQRAGQAMQRRLQRRVRVAAPDEALRPQPAVGCDGVLDGEDRRQRLDRDLGRAQRRMERRRAGRRDDRHWLARVLHHLGRQERLVVEDGAPVRAAGQVGRQQHVDHAGQRAQGVGVQAQQASMGDGRGHHAHEQLTRDGRRVVDVAGGAGDMQAGGLMRDRPSNGAHRTLPSDASTWPRRRSRLATRAVR